MSRKTKVFGGYADIMDIPKEVYINIGGIHMSGIGSIGSQNAYVMHDALDKTVKKNKQAAPGMERANDPNTIRRLWDEAGAATQAMRDIVSQLLSPNAEKNNRGQVFWAVRANSEQFNLKVDAELQAEALEMIGEDGYFGVKQTTDRLMQFAKAMAGPNATPEQIEELRAGVQQGFDAVAKMFGGFDKLPQVTKDTYKATMAAFDEWAGVAK